jgi:hypothetical protein
MLGTCWSTNPIQRPTFSKVVKEFKKLRESFGQEIVEFPQIPATDEIQSMAFSFSANKQPISTREYDVLLDDPRELFSMRFSSSLCLLPAKRTTFYRN